ncbi:MAG: ABC transporter permease [Acidobacteria bacterium]|nr:ABC transporter permease [Acidobacteriota bacterium]
MPGSIVLFVTYLGFVVRRIWARRMMLLGSFLGATLVTALLVVLPLYEASVSAVDLLFTFRQAPDASVNLQAISSTTAYTPAGADAARGAVAASAAPIAAWYPTIEERTLSREYLFVPLGNPDWLGLAEEWRRAGGEASGETAPYPSPPQEATQTRFITAPDIGERIELLEGELLDQQDPSSMEEPILRVVLGEAVATLTRLGVGDRVVLRGFTSLPAVFEMVEVSGIARPIDPTAALWANTSPQDLVMISEASFDLWSGSFGVADAEIDPWLRTTRGLQRVQTGQTFSLSLDREAVRLENVEVLARGVTGFTRSVAQSEGIRTITQLPALIGEFDVRKVVFGAPILAMLALIVAGALYFLIYMAGLALEQEAAELSLLRMRGATPWQTTGLHLMQSLLIAVGAMIVAPVVARAMVSVTGRIPPMSTLTGGEPLTVASGRSIIPFVVAGGVLTFVSMGLAILPIARRSVLELRAIASRPARRSIWQRYNLDLFLVVTAGVILFELRQQGIVDTDSADIGLDPFSIAAPALFLFSGALLLLRVLPWILKGIGWLMTRTKGMTAALPGWHLGRNPIPYGRLALLVWLTTGFGAFALTYAATLESSYADRALYAAGADARIVAEGAAYLTVPDGAVGSPVFRGVGAPRLAPRGAELLAVDPETFPSVLGWRGDFGAATAEDAFGPGVLGGRADWGVELPAGVTSIGVDGLLIPEPWAERERSGPQDPVRLLARLVDERGRFRVHAADVSFTDEGWSTVSIDLSGVTALSGPLPDAESLVLQAVWVERDGGPGAAVDAGRVLVDAWLAISPGGSESIQSQVDAELSAQSNLRLERVDGTAAADVFFDQIPPGVPIPNAAERAASRYWRDGRVAQWTIPSATRGQPVPHLRHIPEQRLEFVLDSEAARTAGLGVGSEALFGVEAVTVSGVVTGVVELIPTTGDERLTGVLVTRLDGLLLRMSAQPSWSFTGTIARSPLPEELWIDTDAPNDVVRIVLTELGAEPDEVITANGVSADFSSRPIQVGLVSILLIGTGAGVVLALAGVTGYVLVAVRRRYREMGVLRALGFRRRSVAGTFALEQVVVLGVGAIVGVAAGIGLMRLMIPFLQLGEEAEDLVPPAIMQIATGRLVLYLVVVAALLVLAVLASTRSVSARRLSEVLREVER